MLGKDRDMLEASPLKTLLLAEKDQKLNILSIKVERLRKTHSPESNSVCNINNGHSFIHGRNLTAKQENKG